MTPEDFKRADELLSDPDAEDCERFASWYGRALLEAARNQDDLLAALEACLKLIGSEYTDAEAAALQGHQIHSDARKEWDAGWAAIAKATGADQ